jgi:hypothetical protein
MVKINDPRSDTAAVAMRSLRASRTYKTIKKLVGKYKNSDEDKLKFDEDKFNFQKIDTNFHNDFVSCPESIKQELIFLWEEVGHLYDDMDMDMNTENNKENDQENDQENDETKAIEDYVSFNYENNEVPPPPKRRYIMGP